MSFTEFEALRAETGLGVDAFLRYSGVSKSSYYRRKRQGGKRKTRYPSLKLRSNACVTSIPA